MFPSEFEKNMRVILNTQYVDFEQSMRENPPVSIRINNKTQIDFTTCTKKVKWCKSGFYLDMRPQFTLDVLLHSGAYYVQEASSMFLEQIVKQCFNEVKTVLDLCAAPGGKSTLLLNAVDKDTLLISNELIHSRANILNENIIKWGNDNIVVTNNKPYDFKRLTSFFDVILVDAPCSGEGMFRKDVQAIAEWSPALVKMCAARQRKILADIWDALKTDGILIYSTCTFNRAENEENTQWIAKILGAEIIKINISCFPEITETEGGYHFYPHKIKGEGFYISILKKKSRTEKNTFRIFQNRKNIIKTEKFSSLGEFVGTEENNFIKYYNSNFYNEFQFFSKNFKTLKSGLTLGERKGKDIIPSHELAMSKIIDIKQFNTIEVDYPTAIKFLRKENIFEKDKSLGYFLLLFKNTPIGWIKNIGNRFNNLYINEWRIRMK